MVRINSLNIVGAEYQFDRAKLTLFYTANMRVDFRFLVKKLFSIFLTRVWLRKVNTNLTFDPPYYSVIALRTGFINPNLQPNGMMSTESSIPAAVHQKVSPSSVVHSPPHYIQQQQQQPQQQRHQYEPIGTRQNTPPHAYPTTNNIVRAPYTVEFSEKYEPPQAQPQQQKQQYQHNNNEMNIFSLLSSVPVYRVPSNGDSGSDEEKSFDSEYSYF
jgi:hypothetical protein